MGAGFPLSWACVCAVATAGEWARLTQVRGRFQPRLFTGVVDNLVARLVDKCREARNGGACDGMAKAWPAPSFQASSGQRGAGGGDVRGIGCAETACSTASASTVAA